LLLKEVQIRLFIYLFIVTSVVKRCLWLI